MHRLQKIKAASGSLLFLAGLVSIGAYVVENWGDFLQTFSRANLTLLSISVFALLTFNLLISLLFWRILTRLGFDVKAGRVARTFMLSQIAKYVPGKIWMIFFQKSSFRNAVPVSSLTFANIYFIFLAFVLTFFIGLTSFILTIDWRLVFPATILGGAGFALIQKNTFFWRICEKFSKIRSDWNLEPRFFQSQALLYLLVVGTYIMANYSLIQSLYDLNSDSTLLIVATLAISWTLSSLVVVIPSGIVLRELIFFAITSYSAPNLDYALIASIAVSSRFWLVTADLLGAAVTLAYSGLMKARVHE